MNIRNRRIKKPSGFSLIELMVVIAIVATLVGIAVPSYQTYTVRAKVSEGLALMSGTKSNIAGFYSARKRLPENFEELGLGTATGSAFGGDSASFESIYGFDSEIWRSVEWQPKSGGNILVFRSKRKPEWDNVDIGLHLQVKADGENVRFRCVVNNNPTRKAWVPVQCRSGGVNQWGW